MSTRIQLRAGETYVLEVQAAEARELKHAHEATAAAARERDRAQGRITTLADERDFLKRDLARAHDATAAAVRRGDDAHGRIDILKAELEERTDERDFLKGNLARARAGHDLLMSRNTALREDLAKSQRRERKLQDRIDTIKEVLR